MDTVQITDSQKELLIAKLQSDLEKIDVKLKQLQDEKKETLELIEKFKSSLPTTNPGKRQSLLKGRNFSWKSISLDILSKRRAFLTTEEVYNDFIELNPDFTSHDKRNIQASISGALSQLSTANQVVRIEKKFGKGNFWGLPDWFGPEGEAFEEFKSNLITLGATDFRYTPISN